MTESDIVVIESDLGVRVPSDYRLFMLSQSAQKIEGVFTDTHQIISTNVRNRQMSWLDRPLEQSFYVFGADEHGHELFMDLDFPEPLIMVADYERKRGKFLAMTFRDWASRSLQLAASRKQKPWWKVW